MPESGTNIRYELLVNGKSRCIAGLPLFGSLHVDVIWVRRDLAKMPKQPVEGYSCNEDDWVDNGIRARVSGFDSVVRELLEWEATEMCVGDEVTIRILPPGKCDDASKRSPFGPLKNAKGRRGAKKKTRKSS